MPNLMDMYRMLPFFAKLTMAVAVVPFGLAAAYAIRPTELKLALMRPVSLASLFAAVAGVLGGWIAILSAVAATPDGHVPTSALSHGIAASLTSGFVCFGFLAAAWLLVATGVLRRGLA
jgi:hypothetical protein